MEGIFIILFFLAGVIVLSVLLTAPENQKIRAVLFAVSCSCCCALGVYLGNSATKVKIGMIQKSVDIVTNSVAHPSKEYTDQEAALGFLKLFPHVEFLEGTGVPDENGDLHPYTELYEIIENNIKTEFNKPE